MVSVSATEIANACMYRRFRSSRRASGIGPDESAAAIPYTPQSLSLNNRGRCVMKMHQVSYFLALCEEKSFTRAAKRCGVKQPSITRAIKELENEIGGALFERTHSYIRLTNLGRLVRPDFTQIERSATEARLKIVQIHDRSLDCKSKRRTVEANVRVVAVTAVTIAVLMMGLALSSDTGRNSSAERSDERADRPSGAAGYDRYQIPSGIDHWGFDLTSLRRWEPCGPSPPARGPALWRRQSPWSAARRNRPGPSALRARRRWCRRAR